MNLSCISPLHILAQVLGILARCLTIISSLNRTFSGRKACEKGILEIGRKFTIRLVDTMVVSGASGEGDYTMAARATTTKAPKTEPWETPTLQGEEATQETKEQRSEKSRPSTALRRSRGKRATYAIPQKVEEAEVEFHSLYRFAGPR